MDEPKGTTQDTLQPKAGHPLGSEAGTPEPETPTLTETQAKERAAKEVQDALRAAGRTAKGFEGREATVKAREEAAETRQKAIDDAEFQAIKGDPDLEAAYKSKKQLAEDRRTLAEDRRKLDQDKLQHQADIDAANATKKEIQVWEIAQKYGVDANALKELNLETPEQIEAVAKAMAAGKAPGDTKTPPGGEPDSLKTKGGGELSEEQRLKARYPTMK